MARGRLAAPSHYALRSIRTDISALERFVATKRAATWVGSGSKAQLYEHRAGAIRP